MSVRPEGPEHEVNTLMGFIHEAIEESQDADMPDLVQKLETLKKATARKFHWSPQDVETSRISRGMHQKAGEPQRILNEEIFPEYAGEDNVVDACLKLVRTQLVFTRNYFQMRPPGTGAPNPLGGPPGENAL